MINKEFDAITKLDHPLIAEVLEVFLDENFVYFVSPFYTGGELMDKIIDDETKKDGGQSSIKPLTEDAIKPIIYQTLRALNYLKSKGIIHRDMKPENIMLESYKNLEQSLIKIIDFGYSLDLNKNLSDS